MLLSPTNTTTSAVVSAIITITLVPLIFYFRYKYLTPDINRHIDIIINSDFVHSTVIIPALNLAVASGSFTVKIVCASPLIYPDLSLMLTLPIDLTTIENLITNYLLLFEDLSREFHEVSQMVSNDEYLDSPRFYDSEELQERILNRLKIVLSLVRHLEAIVRAYNPLYQSPLEPTWVEN